MGNNSASEVDDARFVASDLFEFLVQEMAFRQIACASNLFRYSDKINNTAHARISLTRE